MYERNAIVIDRYFASVFGYDQKNNIKVNGNYYFELVDILEKYQNASEIENNVMAEYERIANKIRETQKIQEKLNNKTLKYYEERKGIFEDLSEDEQNLKNRFEKIQTELQKNETEIKQNLETFIAEIKEFNEKSEIRNKCGRERRVIESDYQKKLDVTVDNFKDILKEKLKQLKTFLKQEDKEQTKNEIKEKIQKNGAKEKVPFDENVINKAIDTSLYIEGKKAEILLSIYDKTAKLLAEIKNDSVKIEKHKKQVKDSRSKLEFLNVISDYIVLFLDNERMNTIGGEIEHKKIMNQACENLQNDLVEIQNMYSLLIKEINGKSTKKSYKDLYNIDYLNTLKEQELKFEKNISKLNMAGAVIYPDYWRIEGMQKIYDTFRNIMTDVYEVDLSEYEPLDITFEVNKNILDEEQEKQNDKEDENIEASYLDKEDKKYKEEIKEEQPKEVKNEIKINFDNTSYEDDEFHWDEDDEDDELIFDKNEENIEEEIETETEKEIILPNETENDIEDDERDKEIDELLGIFDTDDIDDTDENDKAVEEHILQIEDDEDLNDDIFDNEDEKEELKKEEKPKRRKSLFGRRK